MKRFRLECQTHHEYEIFIVDPLEELLKKIEKSKNCSITATSLLKEIIRNND